MAIPTSGEVRFSDLQAEFGGEPPISIGEYYKGGSRVPNISTNKNIPTSGTISLKEFRGGSKNPPLTAIDISRVTVSRSVCEARIEDIAYFDNGLNIGSNAYSDSSGAVLLRDGYYNTEQGFGILIERGEIKTTISCRR